MGPFEDGWSKEDVESVLRRGLPSELLFVPIVVGMAAPDCGAQWAEDVCLRLAGHPDERVRANALLGLGHVARTTRQLQVEAAAAAIRSGLRDDSALVRSQAEEAASDVRVFLRLASFLQDHPG